MYRLFYSPNACSIAPHISLREAELPFELTRVDLGTKQTDSGEDYRAINPKGSVPALRLPNSELLTENAIVIQYIADQAPRKMLAPALGTFERVRFNELLHFIATELHKGVFPIYSPKASDEYKASLKQDRLVPRFTLLGDVLGERSFFGGDQLTVADAYSFYCLRVFRRFIQPQLPSERLERYYQRLLERPSIQKSLEAEGISG